MTVIGALARVEAASAEVVQHNLATIPGVIPFPLNEAAKLGLLIEAATLDDAYHLLHEEIKGVEGVLTVWPVYVDFEEQSLWN